MSRIYSEEEKSEYLEAYHKSGKSKTEFSRENNIPEATFRAWINNENRSVYGMIDVKKLEEYQAKRAESPTVFINSKIRIELQEGYDKDFLKSVIEVMINDTKVIK